MSDKIRDEHLRRGAIVYVRQSTATQLIENTKSQRRQYALAERARQLGFGRVDVIDDDLGRSGSGRVERPGFQRLVAAVCAGDVGAVFSIEASRLARNGRDWHHLIDLSGLVGALVVDGDGIYDPRSSSDRLVLGLKGSMSEFELGLLRQRSFEAIRSKAGRGELEFCLPVGLSWLHEGAIDLDADHRVQEAIRLVFRKFDELGSVRQVLLWMREHKIVLPARTYGKEARKPTWKLPVYNTIRAVITNPMYAGAYTFGRTEDRTTVVQGRAHKTRGHRKTRDRWTVLIHDHHPGYVSWAVYEKNQTTLAENAHMHKRMTRKAGRGGRALLGGILRCRRCGRMLHVTYTGTGGRSVRYACRGANINHGEAGCISFGGLRPDQTIAAALLEVIQPNAVDAAIAAATKSGAERDDRAHAVELELQQVRYEERLAARRYESVDPDNRLVAGELEIRWNAALARVSEVEARLRKLRNDAVRPVEVDRDALLRLAVDLPTVWNAAAADMRLKQRIVRLLISEVVADVDTQSHELVFIIHWVGGRHTEMRTPKVASGHHRNSTGDDPVDVVRRMSGRWSDEQVAATLNRLGLRTGLGNTWNEKRVQSLRTRLELPAKATHHGAEESFTLDQAAQHLGVSATVVRKLIAKGELAAEQVSPSAPWYIRASALASEPVLLAVQNASRRGKSRRASAADVRSLHLPGLKSRGA